MVDLPYTSLDSAEGEILRKAHDDDAAFDLRASIPREYYAEEDSWTTGELYLEPGDHCLVKTGIRIAVPFGYAGFVLPRSGLALKHGITVLNSPGLIDSGYRGEVGVILHNASRMPYTVKDGDRIAQLLVVKTADVLTLPLHPIDFEDYYGDTARGAGGFGSTGR